MTPEEEAAWFKEMADAQAKATTPEAIAAHERHVRWEINKSIVRWRSGRPCGTCGEIVGHWGGPHRIDGAGDPRPQCKELPSNVYLEELRPNCFDVRRHRIGDAIRHATTKAST